MKKTTGLLCLLLSAAPLQAGTGIQARVQSYADKEAWTDIRASIDQDKMRLDFHGPWSHGSLIYDRETSLLTAVDDFQKTKTPITAEDQAALKILATLALSIAQSRAEKGNGNGRKTFDLLKGNVRIFFNGEPRLAAKGVKAAGLVCDKYVTDLGGKRAREVWVVPPDKTPMGEEDYHTFRSLVHLALDLAGGELTQLGADPDSFQRLLSVDELPVLSVLYEKGKPSARFEITRMAPQSFVPADFAPPPGYQTLGLMDLMKAQASAKP